MLVPAITGVVLALAVSTYAAVIRLDRDRAFYPTVLIVIAFYYVLFAIIGGNVHTIIVESIFALTFLSIATVGFGRNLWLVVAALATHGIFDLFHHSLVSNPAVPVWWPFFCLAYDAFAAAALARLLLRRAPAARPH